MEENPDWQPIPNLLRTKAAAAMEVQEEDATGDGSQQEEEEEPDDGLTAEQREMLREEERRNAAESRLDAVVCAQERRVGVARHRMRAAHNGARRDGAAHAGHKHRRATVVVEDKHNALVEESTTRNGGLDDGTSAGVACRTTSRKMPHTQITVIFLTAKKRRTILGARGPRAWQ